MKGASRMEFNEKEDQVEKDRVDTLPESYTSMPMLMELLAEIRLD